MSVDWDSCQDDNLEILNSILVRRIVTEPQMHVGAQHVDLEMQFSVPVLFNICRIQIDIQMLLPSHKSMTTLIPKKQP